MSANRFAKNALLNALLLMPAFTAASAHPWGGIKALDDGDLYFATVCPPEGPGHRTCVYRLGVDGRAQIVLTAESDPSDIVLARAPAGQIYAAERDGTDNRWRARLWRLEGPGQWTEIIPPTFQEDELFIRAYAVLGLPPEEEVVYASADGKLLYRRRLDGQSAGWVGTEEGFTGIGDMQVGPGNLIYVVDGRSLKAVSPLGEVTVIKPDLSSEHPSNLPFRGANIVFDIEMDEAGNAYLAYFGNRQVLKVTQDGMQSVVLESEYPWSPSGVTRRNGKFVVMETTFPSRRPDGRIETRIREQSVDGTLSQIYPEVRPGD